MEEKEMATAEKRTNKTDDSAYTIADQVLPLSEE